MAGIQRISLHVIPIRFITDITIWKRGWQRRPRYMKIWTIRTRKFNENPFAKFCCPGRTWKGKLWRCHENLEHFIQNNGSLGYLWHSGQFLQLNIIQLFSSSFWKIKRVWSVLRVFFWFVYFFAFKQCRVRFEN